MNESTPLAGQRLVYAPFASRIELTGSDRTRFVHNFCTADIKNLPVGACCEAFFTNGKGHVLAHALVAATTDRLLVYSLASDLPALVPHLDRYIIRDDVALADTSAEPGPWLVAGDWPGESDLAIETNAFGPMLTLVDGSSARRRSLAEGLSQLHQTDPAEFASLRIAAGWPMHGIDFDDRALPQELSRTDQAISFAKGCYLGQETVARLDALGHVNKQLVRLSLAGDATVHAPAALTMGDRPAGQLTSLAVDPAGDAQVALATVRSEFAGAGCQLDCGGAACVVL